MNQFLKNHQLNKVEFGVTDESISDWISGLQDTFSSTLDHTNDGQANLKQYKTLEMSNPAIQLNCYSDILF